MHINESIFNVVTQYFVQIGPSSNKKFVLLLYIKVSGGN